MIKDAVFTFGCVMVIAACIFGFTQSVTQYHLEQELEKCLNQ